METGNACGFRSGWLLGRRMMMHRDFSPPYTLCTPFIFDPFYHGVGHDEKTVVAFLGADVIFWEDYRTDILPANNTNGI
jgi:hypothetical protein